MAARIAAGASLVNGWRNGRAVRRIGGSLRTVVRSAFRRLSALPRRTAGAQDRGGGSDRNSRWGKPAMTIQKSDQPDAFLTFEQEGWEANSAGYDRHFSP